MPDTIPQPRRLNDTEREAANREAAAKQAAEAAANPAVPEPAPESGEPFLPVDAIHTLADPALERLAVGAASWLRRDGGTYWFAELAERLDADPVALRQALSFAVLHHLAELTPDGRLRAWSAAS